VHKQSIDDKGLDHKCNVSSVVTYWGVDSNWMLL